MSGTASFAIDTLDSPSGAKILKIKGSLTLQTLVAFQELVRLEYKKPVIVDLSGVPYMDSSGLGSVIGAFASCQKTNRGFALTGINERVRELFQISHVDTLLPCFDSLEAAEKNLLRARGGAG